MGVVVYVLLDLSRAFAILCEKIYDLLAVFTKYLRERFISHK